eukprot:gene36564-biopygen10004
MQVPRLSIAMAGHATRLLHCRHLSIRSNVIKPLCPYSPEWTSQGACPLHCHPDARDSYDHWASQCTHPQLLALRTTLLRHHREDLLALALVSQQDLAAALLDLFLLPDGYRVALGNLSHAQSARLFPLYLNLPGPSSSLLRGRAPGVYNSYEQAHAQIHQFLGGKLSKHSDETLAHGALTHWQSAYARFPAPDPARPLHRTFIDGSASGRQSAPPRLAGWGLTVLSSNQPEPHSDQYGPVITDPSEPDFLGASAPTTNTGEVSVVIWALRWIEARPLAPTQALVDICSDSFYAMDHTAGLLPTQDWGLLPKGDLLHSASNALESLVTRGIHLAFRKVKAHSSLRDRDATLNDRADRLAKRGMRHSGGDTPSLSPLAPFPRPASTLTVTISIASDVAQSTFSWGLAIAQVPPDGAPEVLLHAAAGFPILSPPHRLFIQSTATSPHSTLLAGLHASVTWLL